MNKIIFSPEAQEKFLFLTKQSKISKIERSIINSLNKKIEILKNDKNYGQPIAKRLIPEFYVQKYNIRNLFRLELPNFWRVLYTVDNDEIEIIAIIIDIVDHKEYNKKFNYKTR